MTLHPDVTGVFVSWKNLFLQSRSQRTDIYQKNLFILQAVMLLEYNFFFLKERKWSITLSHQQRVFSSDLAIFPLNGQQSRDCSYSFGSLCYRCTSIMLGRRSSYLIDLLLCYSTIFICSCSCVIQQIFTLPLCPRKHWETSVFIWNTIEFSPYAQTMKFGRHA